MKHTKFLTSTILLFLIIPNVTFSWTKEGTIYTTDGSRHDAGTAIEDANPGDTITIPEGTFNWGTNSSAILSIYKSVQVVGAGIDRTVINILPTASSGLSGTIRFYMDGDASFGGVTINGPAVAGRPPFSVHDHLAPGTWRIHDVKYVQQEGYSSYFVFGVQSTAGLIDNCEITGGAGNSELIFVRGPTNSWDTEDSLGGPGNVFIEDCTFNGSGYVCDAHANSRVVVRYCTINGKIKVDGHGVWSNSNPSRGVRHMEVYGNHWTNTAQAWTAIEIRGGTGMVFNNTADLAAGLNGAWFYLTEYGVFNNNGAFTQYQTPADYPIRDQIGRGKYATAGDWTTATSEPMYVWNNLKGGAQWPFAYKNIPQASKDVYGADFGWENVIQADRDYFRWVSSFDGTAGVGMGTVAEMSAITPTKTGVGFWVTDEGEWNSTNPGPDGRLYVWDGSGWMLKYTPYTYPHPLAGAGTPPNPPVPTEPSTPTGLRIISN